MTGSLPSSGVAGGLHARLRRACRPVALVAAVMALALGSACGGKGDGTPPPTPVPTPAPTVRAFSAPSYLFDGPTSSGQLAWDVSGATKLSIDNGIGTVTGTTTWVHPTVTTTYTLTASNAGGSTTATCTLTVFPAAAGPTSLLANIPNTPLVDGPAALARFNYTEAVAMDPAGNLFIADYGNQSIRMLSPQGIVSTPVSGVPKGGPRALAVGPSGYLYFFVGSSLCKVKPGNAVIPVAGLPDQDGSADGSGTAALFNFPDGLAVDASENVYVADTNNHTIRRVTPQGEVSTLAGSAGAAGRVDGTGAAARFTRPRGIVVAQSGDLLVVDSGNWALRSITPQGAVTTRAPWPTTLPLTGPNALAAGPDGSLFVGGSNAIARIAPDGSASTLAGAEGQFGWVDGPSTTARFSTVTALAVDASGNVLIADYQNSAIRKVTPAGVVSTLAGRLANPSQGPVNIGVDIYGNVFAPASNNTILKITPFGVESTFAGVPGQSGNLDGPAAQALFGAAMSTAVDGSGNVYVTDKLNATLRKITPSGEVSTVAGAPGQAGHQDGLGAQARFEGPTGIAVDDQGTIYVTDGNGAIRKMTSDGNVTTVAGMAGQTGFTDGKGPVARFNHPYGLAVDAAGNLFIADCFNAAIRKIDPSGEVTTLKFTLGSAGSAGVATVGKLLYSPNGIAVDGHGNVYAQDFGSQAPWRISPAGVACRIPYFGSNATLNFNGTGIALRGGTLYSASSWGVALVNLF